MEKCAKGVHVHPRVYVRLAYMCTLECTRDWMKRICGALASLKWATSLIRGVIVRVEDGLYSSAPPSPPMGSFFCPVTFIACKRMPISHPSCGAQWLTAATLSASTPRAAPAIWAPWLRPLRGGGGDYCGSSHRGAGVPLGPSS